MRFAGMRIENFLGKKPNYGKIANNSMAARSAEEIAGIKADATLSIAKTNAEATEKAGAAQASASQFGGIMGGLSSGIAGGLGTLGKSSGYTNNPGAKISDPTADIQRALGPGVKFGMY